jgi:hypothetical protein
MFIESEVMLGAMLKLMEDGIASLSVHDSLIVPISQLHLAEEVLSGHYHQQIGIRPVLKMNYPLPSEPVERDDLEFKDAEFAESEQDIPEQDTEWDDPDPYGCGDDQQAGDDLPAHDSEEDERDNDYDGGREQEDLSSEGTEDGGHHRGRSRERKPNNYDEDGGNEYDSSAYF